MAHLLPSPKMQFFDLNGDPLSGGKVNAYEAGTSTRKATYTTAAATVANANPVILDSRGEASIFWSTGSYKITLTDIDDNEIYTVDNITLSATGPSGASFRCGSGVPSDSLGSDSDRYLRIDTGQIYLKSSGVYSVESTMALPASVIVNTPSGNLAATNVQAALNELQADVDIALAAGPVSDTLINSFSTVTPVGVDYIAIADASDSNKNKKALLSLVRNSVYRSVTTTDAVGVDDCTMKLSGASFTSTLPTAVGCEGKKYKYIHAGTSLSQVYTIATTSSQTVGGLASGVWKLVTSGEVLEVESDGANWMVTYHYAKTAPASYTPTFTGFGTVTSPGFIWYRDGKNIFIDGIFTCGTTTAVTARISVPTNVTIDTALLIAAQSQALGFIVAANSTGTALPVNSRGPWPLIYESGQSTTVSLGRDTDTDDTFYVLTLATANFSSGNKGAVHGLKLPVVDWQP